MKRFEQVLLALLLLPALALAKVPDDEDILDRTMNTASPFYYTKLMMRYNAGDSTMTDEDYHYLYTATPSRMPTSPSPRTRRSTAC